mmetsp:Transcript_4073/g.4492  ORF Transcript_4073/g.4492 Transcript_4073/m.4492 type:complete len:451 (+) Transcript_4073:81-1433(+)
MITFLWLALGVTCVACVVLQLYKRSQQQEQTTSPEFRTFQRNYLLVYYVVVCSDWLQGPYVYALYDHYGFKKQQIATLFIAGFGSSMVFGTFVGALADKYGRKTMALAFGVFYIVSCVTKLFNDFNMLLLGRITGGVATSLLFSTFEAWMICEHNKHQFSESWLSDTFSWSTFGNGVVAILSGVLASFVARSYGFVAPFMTSILFLAVEMIIVFFTWTENYGDAKIEIQGTFTNAINAMRNDLRIPLLGLIQSLFEGSMYLFVFMWTPMLENVAKEDFKTEGGLHGLIFAAFMIAMMVGSSVFSLAVGTMKMSIESLIKVVFLTATCALAVPVFIKQANIILIAFMVFEACCGMYFPCIGSLRGRIIPEDNRAAIMNFFRVPLNIIVVSTLYFIDSLGDDTIFLLCACGLAGALGLTMILTSATTPESKIVSKETDWVSQMEDDKASSDV